MEFHHQDEQHLSIRNLPGPLAALIMAIPEVARASNDEDVAERIFPTPSDAEDPIRKEWQEFVIPELQQLFQEARDTVAKDLKAMGLSKGEITKGLFSLVIPKQNIEAWLHCLNQARLVLASRIQYREGESAGLSLKSPPTDREMKIFQIDFYALLQEWLLEVLDGTA